MVESLHSHGPCRLRVGSSIVSVLRNPTVGDWYCFPQSLVPLGRSRVEKNRPWIVAGSGSVILNPPVVPRSTKEEYGGFFHPAHDGECGTPLCGIDRPGWIGGEFRGRILQNVEFKEFTSERRSCHEPDDDVKEEVMAREERARRATARRRHRGRR